MIKSLKRNDIRYTPFIANKSWNAQNKRFEDLISWQSGSESGSLLLTFLDYGDGTKMSEVSSAFSSAIAYQQQDPDFIRFKIGKEITGSTFYTIDNKYYNSETNPVNIDDSYQRLVYNTVKNLYYKESENPTQIFGLESLDSSEVNRTLPKQVSIFNLPVNKFGEKIQPSSVKISHDLPIGNTVVIDDGNNNLKISGSTFSDIQNAEFNCVSASIQYGNLTQTYNGTARSASITTIPPNLSVSTTYNGSSTPPTNAGTYTVFSEIIDGFYCGNKTSTFNINKAPASIIVSFDSFSYNGNAQTPTSVLTSPLGLSYVLTYKNNSTNLNVESVVDVGTYTVTATITDSNYSGQSVSTLTITPRSSNISFSSISNVIYGDVWEIIPPAIDTVNGFPIVYSITSGTNLAQVVGTGVNQKISLEKSKTATSLSSVTVTATTVPTISGFSPTSTTKSFTISPRQLTISGVLAEDKIIGTGTTVTINNSNKKLDNLVGTDIVNFSSIPSTGIISTDIIPNTLPVTLSSNYTITGTHSSKYTLKQPSLSVKIYSQKITLKSPLTFTYDTIERNIKDILTDSSLKSIETLIVDYYSNNQRIGGEKYSLGQFVSSDGVKPTNFGKYKVKITNDGLTVDEVVEVEITIQKALATITLDNLNQGGIKSIKYSEKSTKIKPLSEEITSVNVVNISIPDRYGKIVNLNNLISNTTILYNSTTTKPTTTGNYTLTSNLNSSNVYSSNVTNLKINDFIYIVTKGVYETYNGELNLTNQYTSSRINFKKYFDPSVTGSWNTVKSTYPSLTSLDLFTPTYNITPYLQIGLIGAGGGAYVENSYQNTDKNITIKYFNSENTLVGTYYKSTPINNYLNTELFFQQSSNGSVIQTGYFYVSSDNYAINFTLESTNARLYIDDELLLECVFSTQLQTIVPVTKTVSKTFSRGYHYIKFEYSKTATSNVFNLSYNPNINFVSLMSQNYGGGSGASIGLTLPAKYIIDKDLQTVKFVVGQSGFSEFNQENPEISSFIQGYPAEGNGPKIAEGSLFNGNNIVQYFKDNAPILKNFKFKTLFGSIIETPSPTNDLIFIGRDVTQSRLNSFGIQTPISNIIKIQPGDTLDISSTVTVDDFISIGYYIWNTSIPSSYPYNYKRIYSQLYTAPDRQYSSLNGTIVVPSTFTSTDILVIGFEDQAVYLPGAETQVGPRSSHGLNDLTITVKPNTTPFKYDGGNTYMITGSLTGSSYSYLGIIAGSGKTINGPNNGTSSLLGLPYTGIVGYQSSTPLYTEFNNYVTNPSVVPDSNYNVSFNGNSGQIGLIGGDSVDPTVNNKIYGKGAGSANGSNANWGIRGNYVVSSSNVLYEIYANSSSVYNITQVI